MIDSLFETAIINYQLSTINYLLAVYVEIAGAGAGWTATAR
ncbi:MAG: hypothetical protein SF339_22950 [Blastocatellia bacterium]|nr:hypothetical protein [Blastocatellia bacterium]